jgi:hypothetical protein
MRRRTQSERDFGCLPGGCLVRRTHDRLTKEDYPDTHLEDSIRCPLLGERALVRQSRFWPLPERVWLGTICGQRKSSRSRELEDCRPGLEGSKRVTHVRPGGRGQSEMTGRPVAGVQFCAACSVQRAGSQHHGEKLGNPWWMHGSLTARRRRDKKPKAGTII